MKAKLALGAVWIAATRGATNLIGFVSTLLLAKLLVPEDFGLVAIATTLIAITTSVTEVSLSHALVQHRDPTEEHYHTAFTLGVIRAGLVAAITAALAWPIAALYGDDRLIALILALAAGSALSGLSNPKLVDLVRALVFQQQFLLGVSNKLIGFVVAAAIAIVWSSYWAIAAAAIVSQISQVVLSYILVQYRPHLSLAKTRELMSFSIWLTLSGIVSTLNYRFDTLFIGYFLGKAPLGYYSYGDNLANMVTREATTPIANTLFPAFSRMSDDPARLRAAYLKSQSVLFAVALPVGVGFALIAEPLILAVLGRKWEGAIFVTQVVAAATGLFSIGSTCQSLALALGRTQALFNRDIFSFILRVPILTFALLTEGLMGFMIARTITGFIMLVLNMMLIRSMVGVGIRSQVRNNLRAVSAMLAMVCVVWGAREALGYSAILSNLQNGLMFVEIGFSMLVYGSVSWCIWYFSSRPEGIETEIAAAIRHFINRRLSPSKTSNPSDQG